MPLLIRLFAFTATMTDPHGVCRHSRTAHNWAAPADTSAVTEDVRRLLDAYFTAARLSSAR